jgi:hypothetical protein
MRDGCQKESEVPNEAQEGAGEKTGYRKKDCPPEEAFAAGEEKGRDEEGAGAPRCSEEKSGGAPGSAAT